MAVQKFLNPNPITLVTFLAILAGLSATFGCTTRITSSNASTNDSVTDETQLESPTASDARSEELLAGNQDSTQPLTIEEEPIEPATLETTYLADLPQAKGASYAVVRSKLIADGWIPHTFATNGPVGDFNDVRVQQMQELGFDEVKTCSGTGQGFCLLQFVHRNRTLNGGSVLVVTTAASAPSDTSYPEPTFWDFRVDDVSDTTYVERRFDRALFNQLREEKSFCLGVGRCEYVQYQLKDALLLGGSYDFGTIKTTLILEQPISKEEAIAYAKILDAEDAIDFSSAKVVSEKNTQSYINQDALPEGAAESGSASMAKLVFTESGKVSEISFSILVL